MATSKNKLLESLRGKAREVSSFVAYALAVYQQSNKQSEAQIAEWLGCSVDEFQKLGLCRRPMGKDVTFRREVEQVANFAGADPVKLAQILRASESIIAFRDAPQGSHGTQRLRQAARKAVDAKKDGSGSRSRSEGST